MIKLTSVFALILLLAACGGGSSSSSNEQAEADTPQTDQPPTIADPTMMQEAMAPEPDSMPILALDTAVTFRVAGQLPEFIDGFAPDPSNDESKPQVFSAPDSVEVAPASFAQVELCLLYTSPSPRDS